MEADFILICVELAEQLACLSLCHVLVKSIDSIHQLPLITTQGNNPPNVMTHLQLTFSP